MRPRLLLLTVFGLGRLRPGPGTWGSLPPVAAVLLMTRVGASPGAVDLVLAVICVLFGLVCIAFGPAAEVRYGRKDPSEVVADETAGQCLALLALPWSGRFERDLLIALTAFIAFRVFDIAKPPPIRSLQRFPAGWGILVDDLVAGLFALAVTQLAWRAGVPALTG